MASSASANAESYTVTITNPRSGNTIQQTGITATQWQVPIGEPEGVDYNRGYTVVVTAVNAAGSTDMDAGSQDFVTGTDAAAHWPLGDSEFKDIYNNGHAFNGEGQYVHAPVESGTSPLLDYSKGFALSLWTLSPSSTLNGSYLVAQTGGDAKSGFALYSAMAQTHRADYLVFRAGGTTVFQISRTLLPQSGWIHIVVNYDARNSSFDLWVNGVLTSGENGGSLLAAGDIYLGAEDSQSGYFGGGLDDVRIFNRTLTTEEIALLFEE